MAFIRRGLVYYHEINYEAKCVFSWPMVTGRLMIPLTERVGSQTCRLVCKIKVVWAITHF